MGLLKMLRGEQPNPIEVIFNFENTGQWGEYLTQYALSGRNLPGIKEVITNAYLPYKGHFTEVDVVMVHQKGIFIFESKNYSGWIFGSVTQQKWTQSLPGGHKSHFLNPIIQNATHCRAIADYLGIDPTLLFSYVVFSERCELKAVPESTESCRILKRNQLLTLLRAEIAQRPDVLTPAMVEEYAQRLRATTLVTTEQKQAHVDAIHERMNDPVCPKCGKELVERQGPYGQFLGCSGYPRCRFTRQPTL